MQTLDMIIYAAAIFLGFSFLFILWGYAKGLKESPYEIYLLFFTKISV